MRPHLASLVDDFRAHAHETAIVAHRGVRRYRTSYGELANVAGRFSAELTRRGIEPGERVVLWGANSAEWVAVFFGCMLRGVIAVPLDATGSADFAARVIADTKPKLIVGDEKLLETLRAVKEIHSVTNTNTGVLRLRDSLDANRAAQDDGRSESGGAVLALAEIAQRLPANPLFTVDPAVTLDAPFQIVFTSGTTAEPRGIVHTHRNILVTLDPIEREIAKYRRFERPFHPLRFLHSLPLSHVFGQFMGLWTPALLAAEVHFADQLDPSRIADVIKRDRISVLIAVPRVLHLLRAHLLAQFPGLAEEIEITNSRLTMTSGAKAPRMSGAGYGTAKAVPLSKAKYGDSGHAQRAVQNDADSSVSVNGAPGLSTGALLRKWWRFRRVHRALGWKFWAIISGGATLPSDLEAFYNKIGLALIQGYGMTETAALVTLNHPFHIAPGTIGKTLPGREVKIGVDGEILVRGAMLSGATWQGGAMHAREGEWLATGDLAEESEHGELKFLGRKGDVIVTGAGLNIHPADLEAALAKQPGIRAAAVVPCDFTAGPEPVAVVLTALNDAQLDAEVSAANRSLAEFQQVRRVLRWPEPQFPYTSTGKLVRRKVAEWVCAQFSAKNAADGAVSTAETSYKDALLALISELTGEPAPNASNPNALRLSEDLHLDSLGRVQLQSAIEQRFAIDINDDAIATAETVGDLRALLGQDMGSASIVAHAQALPDGQRPATAAAQQTAPQYEPHAAEPELVPLQSKPRRDEHLYPQWPWSWPIRAMRTAFLELAMRPLVWLLAKPRVVHEPGAREALNARLGSRTSNPDPLLVIANHITAYDGALVLYALPGSLRRRMAAAMSGEMLLDYRRMRNQGNWFLNLLAPAAYWLLTALFNVFPLPRAQGFRRSFAHAGEAMDRGYSVLIFPEGTRSLTGHMNPFRSGIGLLAQETQAPIVPIALRGIYDLVAERDPHAHTGTRPRWFHAGRIEVRVGKPIPATELRGEPAALSAALESTLRRLVE